jgi:hypothetical protein
MPLVASSQEKVQPSPSGTPGNAESPQVSTAPLEVGAMWKKVIASAPV